MAPVANPTDPEAGPSPWSGIVKFLLLVVLIGLIFLLGQQMVRHCFFRGGWVDQREVLKSWQVSEDAKSQGLHPNPAQAYDGRPIGKATHGPLRVPAPDGDRRFFTTVPGIARSDEIQ
jgi:hypothetical protein